MSTPVNSPDSNSVVTNSEENTSVTTDVTTLDNATSNVENATPDVEPKAEVNVSPGKIDETFYQALRSQLTEWVNEHNRLAGEIENAGDRVALKDRLLETPDETNDDSFVSLVTQMKELTDALAAVEREVDAAAEPYIQNALQRSGVADKQAKADEFAKQAKATANYLSAMEASTEGLPTLVGRKGRTTTGTGDGRGSGVAKYRNLDVYVDGKRAEQKGTIKVTDDKGNKVDKNVMKSNLTYGAQAANVPGDVFREKFLEAQGTKNVPDFKDRVEFEIVDGKDEKKTHSVVVLRVPDTK